MRLRSRPRDSRDFSFSLFLGSSGSSLSPSLPSHATTEMGSTPFPSERLKRRTSGFRQWNGAHADQLGDGPDGGMKKQDPKRAQVKLPVKSIASPTRELPSNTKKRNPPFPVITRSPARVKLTASRSVAKREAPTTVARRRARQGVYLK